MSIYVIYAIVFVFTVTGRAVRQLRRLLNVDHYYYIHVDSVCIYAIVFVFTDTGRGVRRIRRLLKVIYHVDHYYYMHVDIVSIYNLY